MSALAPESCAVLPMSACASRPLSSATSMKAATCRNTVMSIQFGGTWISATRAETSSQPDVLELPDRARRRRWPLRRRRRAPTAGRNTAEKTIGQT